jgi:endo-1,4-beta-xylanase
LKNKSRRIIKTRSTVWILIVFIVFLPLQLEAQLAEGQSKFLGNVIASSVPSNYATYWNQVTPENAGKWGSVESSRDSMNWGNLDTAYDYAKGRGFPYKHHTLVWGSQEPGWIGGLSQSEQREEVEEWIRAVGQRYPNMDFVDVVNEPLHAPASYKNALGGDGSTGWDWVIEAFELASQYCSGKLLLNDYGIVNDDSETTNYLEIINLLKNRGLIDGIGVQAHCFNLEDYAVSTIQGNLDRLAATGLPIYPSEVDLRGDDNTQLQRYQEKFPVLWEHSGVKGITLWGYIQGQIWKSEAWLVSSGSSGATERPALQWLREYLQGNWTSAPTEAPTPVPTETPVPTPTPTAPPTVAPGNGDGLLGEYFNGTDLSNLVLSRIDSNIDFNWGGGSPDSAIQEDQFSVRWTGQIEVRMTETYTIITRSDDGMRVWINNQQIIDDWNDHAAGDDTEASGTVSMETGIQYDIRVEYYENGGDASAQLYWSNTYMERELIPQSQLYSGGTPVGTLGDVNDDGDINIVDALLVAQYYVGLNPSGFDVSRADTNCDGSVNIVDALLIAQYYVGLVSEFC